MLKQSGAAIVRLKDVANVTLGNDDYETEVGFDGQQRRLYRHPGGAGRQPAGCHQGRARDLSRHPGATAAGPERPIVYDSTDFVSSSIHEVVRTLVEAVLIVTVVVFVFLGSPRSVLIPVIAIPLSLIGTFTMMLLRSASPSIC